MRQGQTGMGQGGFTCHQFVEAIGEPVTVALRSPIPLETGLDVVHLDDCWHLVDPSDPGTVILEATRWDVDYPSTNAVTIEEAAVAREAFPLTADTHPAPHCMSCGLGEHSLHVHAGPLGDGRWATPFRLPNWSLIDGECRHVAVVDGDGLQLRLVHLPQWPRTPPGRHRAIRGGCSPPNHTGNRLRARRVAGRLFTRVGRTQTRRSRGTLRPVGDLRRKLTILLGSVGMTQRARRST